jgi:hypothetical protein
MFFWFVEEAKELKLDALELTCHLLEVGIPKTVFRYLL